jgi:hypothetical protein
MTQIVSAHFDGKVIVPDEPVGTPLRISVEVQESRKPADGTAAQPAASGAVPRFAGLLALSADLPDAPPDLAAQHDHYR